MIQAKKEIKITKRDIARAASNALRGHRGKREVEDFKTHFADRVEELWQWWESGEWRHRLAYRQLEKTNANGKRRKINSPDLTTRIYQHLFILKVLPLYIRRDNGHRKNCKRGFGITASDKRKSVVSRVKHAYYDRRDCGYIVKIDQRKCYAHIRPTVFANELRRLTTDARFVRFATAICFVDGELPIGTPSSPVAHHITMLRFDHFKTEVCEYGVAYADDDLLFCRTREEAHAALWRCRFFLWYELGIRLKRGAVVQPTAKATDFCGYVFRRREPKRNGHGKGFTRLRRTTFRRVCKATRRSYPAYFGLLLAADSYAAMQRIEKTMRLQQLTEKIRIDRKLDARNIDVKEIAGSTNQIEYINI